MCHRACAQPLAVANGDPPAKRRRKTNDTTVAKSAAADTPAAAAPITITITNNTTVSNVVSAATTATQRIAAAQRISKAKPLFLQEQLEHASVLKRQFESWNERSMHLLRQAESLPYKMMDTCKSLCRQLQRESKKKLLKYNLRLYLKTVYNLQRSADNLLSCASHNMIDGCCNKISKICYPKICDQHKLGFGCCVRQIMDAYKRLEEDTPQSKNYPVIIR